MPNSRLDLNRLFNGFKYIDWIVVKDPAVARVCKISKSDWLPKWDWKNKKAKESTLKLNCPIIMKLDEEVKENVLKFLFGFMVLRLLILLSLDINLGAQIFVARLAFYGLCKTNQPFLNAVGKVISFVPEEVLAVAAIGSLIVRLFPSDLVTAVTLPVLFFGSAVKFIEGLGPEGDDDDEEEDADWAALTAMEIGMLLGYHDASLVILLMLTGGESLEKYALQRAESSFKDIIALAPQKVTVEEDGQVVEVEINEVQIGSTVIVAPEGIIPIDGKLALTDDRVVEIDESTMNGEVAENAKKTDGDDVLAGTVNKTERSFKVIASTDWEHSMFKRYLDQLNKALDEESTNRLNCAQHSENFDHFTLALSFVSYFIHRFVLGKAELAAWKIVLTVLMAATPCPLVIGVPVAFLSGMAAFSRKFKVSFKSAKAIEDLSKTTEVVFDKTGTLTEGVLSVSEIIQFKSKGESELELEAVQEILVSLEQQSKPHPISKAIINTFNNGNIHKVKSVKNNLTGITGVVVYKNMDYNVQLGAKLFDDEDKEGREEARTFYSIEESNNKNTAKGVIYFNDSIRADMKKGIKKLKKQNIGIRILSGDQGEHLPFVAKELGISRVDVCAPHEKGEIVGALAEKGHVVMIGDGVNDAGALGLATVGIAVGTGGLAAEAADMVLLQPQKVPELAEMIKLSKVVVNTAVNAVSLGMTLACIQMLFAASGVLSPFVSACLQEGIDLSTVIFALSVAFQ